MLGSSYSEKCPSYNLTSGTKPPDVPGSEFELESISIRPKWDGFTFLYELGIALAFSPIPDVSSPTVFSPIQNIEGNRLPRTTSPNGFSRVVRPRIFRLPNTLKGKGIRTRNSVNSDSTSWSVKNEKEDLLNDLL